MRLPVLLLLLVLSRVARAEPHYRADFDREVARGWSSQKRGTTSRGGRRYLGPFANQGVTLELTRLPAHRFVRLRFSLLVLGGWTGDRIADGNNKIVGPDQWGLEADGRVLIHTSFSNAVFRKKSRQAYPGDLGQFSVPAGSGARSTGTLGVRRKWAEGSKAADSLYEIDLTIPHTAARLKLTFYGLCLSGDERWGLDDVRVDLPARRPEAGRPLGKVLVALMGKQAGAALRARWTLACAGEAALDLMREKLLRKDPALRDAARVAALIARLGSPKYRERQAASQALARLGQPALPRLRAALGRTDSIEVRWRLEALIDLLQRSKLKITPERLLRERMLQVLTIIDTPAARRLLLRAGGQWGTAALSAGSHWKGLCLQDGYPTYFMGLQIDDRAGDRISGVIHWPATNNSKTRWRGRIVGNRAIFQEYELIQGSGIIIPCDYELRIVGQFLIGPWKGGGQVGGVQLRLAESSSKE